MFNWLKNGFRNRYISVNQNERDKFFVSLKEAKHVGILATIASEKEYIDIFSIFSQIQQTDKVVKMVAYIDSKEVPYYCLQQLTADYFCQKNMNWYGKLMMQQVIDFVNTEFDILIDFTHQFYTPIDTILALSKSKMIAGGNNTQKVHYDFFMDMNEITENRKLIENIDIYTLKLIGKTV